MFPAERWPPGQGATCSLTCPLPASLYRPTSHPCHFHTISLTVCPTFFLHEKWSHLSTATVLHLTPKHPPITLWDLHALHLNTGMIPCSHKIITYNQFTNFHSTYRPSNTVTPIFTKILTVSLCETVPCYLPLRYVVICTLCTLWQISLSKMFIVEIVIYF